MFDTFGKGEIKKCRVSPDGFIQMALQLAYFREYGKHPQTYESCMTRLFRDGMNGAIKSGKQGVGDDYLVNIDTDI